MNKIHDRKEREILEQATIDRLERLASDSLVEYNARVAASRAILEHIRFYQKGPTGGS